MLIFNTDTYLQRRQRKANLHTCICRLCQRRSIHDKRPPTQQLIFFQESSVDRTYFVNETCQIKK